MKLESVGILIELRWVGERDAVARIFSRDHGIMVGIIRGAAVAKKNKPLVGQIGNVSWNARLDSQLGVFHWESEQNMVADNFFNSDALGFINSAFGLLSAMLPEREKYETMWIKTKEFLSGEISSETYLDWEILLLAELGYAIDQSNCGGCGCRNELTHLSPRTGHAVCAKCAEPFLGRLYPLPLNLGITRKFLEKIIVEMGGRDLPLGRKIIH
ncbi:MAG: DNA repair protein RecO [Rickettsiales bacterium]|nr:DNA repair protein RecO [Rickettsiales bacterium]